MLEAEGWKVWWDTSLAIGDDFRNKIMAELGRARAVIVLWTDASIKSDWVRSEAGRAQADRKLIPVKLEHLTYKDLPAPFDVLHTENVSEADKVRAAIVAQLARPAVEPSAVALLTKGFKYELLTWGGIVGGALTLFTNLGAVLKLADWARLLVQHWKEWTHAFWLWAFGWLGIHLPPDWTPVLTFTSFGLFLTIGQAVKFSSTIKNQPGIAKYNDRSFQVIRHSFCCFVTIIATMISGIAFYLLAPATVLIITVPALFIAPQIIIVLFARYRAHATLSVLLATLFFWIIALIPLMRDHTDPYGPPGTESGILVPYTALQMMWVLPLILLSVAPAKAISRRLIFLALGLLLLIALNELSKLGLDLTAPKLQG
jgi:hypothetical protein